MSTDSNDPTALDEIDDESDLEESIAAIVIEVTNASSGLPREDVASLASRRFQDAGIVLDEASLEELVSEITSQN